jgi:hypothetical protein
LGDVGRDIRRDFRETIWNVVDWIYLAQVSEKCLALVKAEEISSSMQVLEFDDCLILK